MTESKAMIPMDHVCEHMNLLTNWLPKVSLEAACRDSSFLALLLKVSHKLSCEILSITPEKPPKDFAKVGHLLNQEVVTFLLESAKMFEDCGRTSLEPNLL
jgi:hypothetical protein